MKQVKLHIPENKYLFLMELLNSFECLTVEEDDLDISEKHKTIVRQRMEASDEDPSRLLDWDKAKQHLRYNNV